MFLSESTFNIEPKVGDFYFFPHYLMHTVYPFSDSDEERRSISFNANIDADIYKVVTAQNDLMLYKASLLHLNPRGMPLQSADVDGDKYKVIIIYKNHI